VTRFSGTSGPPSRCGTRWWADEAFVGAAVDAAVSVPVLDVFADVFPSAGVERGAHPAGVGAGVVGAGLRAPAVTQPAGHAARRIGGKTVGASTRRGRVWIPSATALLGVRGKGDRPLASGRSPLPSSGLDSDDAPPPPEEPVLLAALPRVQEVASSGLASMRALREIPRKYLGRRLSFAAGRTHCSGSPRGCERAARREL